LIIAAALLRLAAVLVPGVVPLLHTAALAWALAFIGFAVVYSPLLIGYRKKKRAAVGRISEA